MIYVVGMYGGFNGATAMKPWRSYKAEGGEIGQTMLQWGHGDEAVEENRVDVVLADHLPASMGPRR